MSRPAAAAAHDLITAISGAAMHPFVIDLEDDPLRAELRRLARRFLGLPN